MVCPRAGHSLHGVAPVPVVARLNKSDSPQARLLWQRALLVGEFDVAMANRNIDLESYKEALKKHKVNCLRRLAASGVYEAAGNAFWLKLASLLAWEGGGVVLGSENSRTQLGVGREEKFKRSADT